MKVRCFLLIAGSFLLVAPYLSAQAILEYKFNETGNTAISTGSSNTALNLLSSSNVATDYHGADGSGVSGLSGDRALDFTSSTGMGSGSTGPIGTHSADNGAIDALRSLTLSGWYKTNGATSLSGAARLFQNSAAGNGFSLLSSTAGTLTLGLGNGTSTNFTSAASYGATEEWVFFAVTYDGSVTTNNVRFYVGGTGTAVSLVSTLSYNGGLLGNDSNNLRIGNEDLGFQRPFDGYLDNMRIYGATGTSNAGALSLQSLESLRSADAIPEPGALALALGASGVLVLFRSRKRKSRL